MTKSKRTSTINAVFKFASLPMRLDAKEEAKTAGQMSVLVFETGNEAFAIAVENVEGVVDCPRITPLPNPPDGIIGVASVRGRMTLVMCLNGSLMPGDSRRRLILVKGEAQLGLFADRIEDVVSFAMKDLRKTANRKGAGGQEAKKGKKWDTFFRHKGRSIAVVEIDQLSDAETPSSG